MRRHTEISCAQTRRYKRPTVGELSDFASAKLSYNRLLAVDDTVHCAIIMLLLAPAGSNSTMVVTPAADKTSYGVELLMSLKPITLKTPQTLLNLTLKS